MPQQLLLTAIPANAFDEDPSLLRISVHVSPRLTHTEPEPVPLTAFDQMLGWPTIAATLGATIVVDGQGELEAKLVGTEGLDQEHWELAVGDTVVRSHVVPDLTGGFVWSFGASALVGDTKLRYTTAATASPTERFDLDDPFLDDYRHIGRMLASREFDLDAVRENLLSSGQHSLGSGDPSLSETFQLAAARRFYRRPGIGDSQDHPEQAPPVERRRLDFHEVVGALGDHPQLLRRFGLVLDLVVPRDELLALTANERGRLRVRMEAAGTTVEGLAAEGARPWTNYLLLPDQFLAEPRDNDGGELVDGMLRVEDTQRFEVAQIDPDGTALKTLAFARGLHDRGKRRAHDEPTGIPSLRAAGLTLLRRGADERLVGLLGDAVTHDADTSADVPADLFAEDVLRGWRVDVGDDATGEWLSLHHRRPVVEIHRPDSSTVTVPGIEVDEGYTKASSVSFVDDGQGTAGSPDLYAHEAVVGWDGWSLSVPRPGRTIVRAADGSEQVIEPPAQPQDDAPVVTTAHVVPGTLPSLRFGRSYRLRVRQVDLAGNSWAPDRMPVEHETAPTPYVRFDPVPSPTLVPRTRWTEGESLYRMVIRSAGGQALSPADQEAAAAAYAADPDVIADLAGWLHTYAATNERHVAPPKTSQLMAEQHGAFDGAMGPGGDPDTFRRIARRDAGSFLHAVAVDTATGEASIPMTGMAVLTSSGVRDLVADPLDPQNGLDPGQYVVHDTDRLVLPYLPDVLARGVSLTTLPGDGGTRLVTFGPWPAGGGAHDLGHDWLDAAPFRLRAVSGTGPPRQLDEPGGADERVLEVLLPPATIASVRIACTVRDEHDLHALGLWSWLTPAQQAQVRADALAGRHWMLTPWQPLVLVHAVEKPLTAPVVDVLPSSAAHRLLGETFASLVGELDNHARSTGRLDVHAAWTEWVDDPHDLDGPKQVSSTALVGGFDVAYEEDEAEVGREESDTPRRHELRHEFGDHHHRLVDYHAVATTRYREYFPPVITEDPDRITHTGQPVTVPVPSSRRPEPPSVRYAIPTFRWEKVAGDALVDAGLGVGRHAGHPGRSARGRRRRGNALRIYLERPWFSSGDGELLGVVLFDEEPPQVGLVRDVFTDGGLTIAHRAGAAAVRRAAERVRRHEHVAGSRRAAAGERVTSSIGGHLDVPVVPVDDVVAGRRRVLGGLGLAIARFEALRKLVTRWGQDPIWGGEPTDDGPRLADFPARVASGYGLTIPDVPGVRVSVAGHEVHFDHDRRLWYADIEITPGNAYTPFVRLGLVRYQPNSLTDAHLSSVVVATHTQVLPDRTTVVSSLGRGRVQVTVQGPAAHNELSEVVSGRFGARTWMHTSRMVTATVERPDPALGASDLAWEATDTTTTLQLRSLVDGIATWQGSLPVTPDQRGSHRILVEEHELLRADPSVATHLVSRGPVREVGDPLTPLPTTPAVARLVYADHFPVS